MLRHKSFARFVAFPENRLALAAIRDFLAHVRTSKGCPTVNILFLHGPPGTGKSHLVAAFAAEVAGSGGRSVQLLAAGDFREPGEATRGSSRPDKKTLAANEAGVGPSALGEEARACDVLVVEDLQHLPLTAAETLVQIIDYRDKFRLPTLFTATTGARHLAFRGTRFPARLTSRLAAAPLTRLEPLSTASRLYLLAELAQRNQLALPHDIAVWLAGNLTGGGRQLEGAISQLATLTKVGRRPPDLKSVAQHFRAQVDAIRPTVQRIASHVASYFRVEPRQLQSRRRHHNVVLPRQVGMYLARQLTTLSLEEIGAYFGGRDHTTVLHACRKVEKAIAKDAVLSGAVRQIHGELG
jgi:chromosomal replication initiator protein